MNSFQNENGQALTEYLTILILVSIVAIAAASTLGKTVKGKLTQANATIQSIKVPKKLKR